MKINKITDVLGKKVYTDAGDFFGEIEEVNLMENKVDSWRVKVSPTNMDLFGGARGVIIPHSFVKAVSDVFIISKVALPKEEPQESQLPQGYEETEEY
ncbi:MAG TPA: PRC-barrel domain-containing protein [Candidatus Nanoarchaeia archaeon]|nr:PRC-barrel domain-containing protein [Candidatus Nanoarchaeia archaeon]